MRATRRTGIGPSAALCAALCGIAMSACVAEAPGTNEVQGQAEIIDRSHQGLTASTVKWVNGTYGVGCIGKASGSWSARIAGTATMDNAALSVVTNNTACTLTVTTLVADQAYPAAPSIALGSAYANTASSMSVGGYLRLYGNAKISDPAFASNFVVSFLYSDDPNAVTTGVTSGHSMVSSTSTATSVTSPSYTVDYATDYFTVLTDAANIVTSTSGKLDLIDGATTGTGYVINAGTLASSPTFAQIDAAYTAGTPVAITGANPQINASAFSLSGVDLTSPVVRTIIVETVTSGVAAYQTIKITIS